jgi:hypothetical protein
MFLMINKRTPPAPLIPSHALVRFQFCAILMRLGLKKHHSIKNLEDRLSQFLKKYVVENMPIGKAQDFRWNKYWNESCDNLYKFHMKLLKEIYNNYSGSQRKPGEENYMCSLEFESIFTRSKLLNARFTNRDINL